MRLNNILSSTNSIMLDTDVHGDYYQLATQLSDMSITPLCHWDHGGGALQVGFHYQGERYYTVIAEATTPAEQRTGSPVAYVQDVLTAIRHLCFTSDMQLHMTLVGQLLNESIVANSENRPMADVFVGYDAATREQTKPNKLRALVEAHWGKVTPDVAQVFYQNQVHALPGGHGLTLLREIRASDRLLFQDTGFGPVSHLMPGRFQDLFLVELYFQGQKQYVLFGCPRHHNGVIAFDYIADAMRAKQYTPMATGVHNFMQAVHPLLRRTMEIVLALWQQHTSSTRTPQNPIFLALAKEELRAMAQGASPAEGDVSHPSGYPAPEASAPLPETQLTGPDWSVLDTGFDPERYRMLVDTFERVVRYDRTDATLLARRSGLSFNIIATFGPAEMQRFAQQAKAAGWREVDFSPHAAGTTVTIYV
jgi:hypothetical protein